jgi:hexosaminidase
MLKKTSLFFLISIICFIANAQTNKINIIPEPVMVTEKPGVFTLKDLYSITIDGNDADTKRISEYLRAVLTRATGFETSAGRQGEVSAIRLSLNKQPDNELGNEGYVLEVSEKNVSISANKPAGLFYGVQSFIQLLPKEIESSKPIKNINWTAPCVKIKDYPRFGWRGLMFDVSRHFFTKDEVKRFIDDMVKYKYNLLHWHLTDDQGWRIEIKSLPKLTSVGAWNVQRTGKFGTFSPTTPDEPRNHGGFYTQNDIKEVVQYAKERFVNILPEIDVPGHSMAAIASYPELTSTAAPAGTYKVNSGEKLMEWPPGGHFYGLLDNSLCPAKENVYVFLDKVFSEVAQLFPFEYIHMGGDETARNFWEKSEDIKQLMKKENLKNLNEVQSYFVKRVEKIINSKGKKLIGWDEILDGGLAPNAAVMSWRGLKGGIEAAKLGHEVVMSPTTYSYIDYMQSDAVMEPPVYASLRLNKAYEFEPVPDGVDAKFIKGGQANLWTEQIYNYRHLQYMVWPRAFATAESVWSPKAKKNWNNFAARVENHFTRFEAADKNYSPAVYDPIFKSKKGKANELLLDLSTEITGLDIHYSFDNSFPDNYYPKFTQTITVPKDATTLKVITYRNGKAMGRMTVMPVEELKKRAGIK